MSIVDILNGSALETCMLKESFGFKSLIEMICLFESFITTASSNSNSILFKTIILLLSFFILNFALNGLLNGLLCIYHITHIFWKLPLELL